MLEILEILSALVIFIVAFAQLFDINLKLRVWLTTGLFLGSFLLIQQVWPLKYAMAFLISGGIGAAVLWMALASTPVHTLISQDSVRIKQSHPLISALAGFIMMLLSYSFAFSLKDWIPSLSALQVGAAFFLIGMGLFQITFHDQILPTTSALLTILTGFLIFFASLVSSVFAVGILCIIILLVALSGAYWMLSETVEEDQL